MRLTPLALLILGSSLWVLACGDEEVVVVPDAGDPTGEGIVTKVSGIVLERAGTDPAAGVLNLKFVLGDEDVTKNVWLELSSGGIDVLEGPGSQQFELSPGLYSARVSYREDSHVEKAKGLLSGLKVNVGLTSSYKIYLDVPLGRLRMNFTQLSNSGETVSIADQIQLAVHRSGDQQGVPVWLGSATDSVALSVGTYDVKASLPGKAGVAIVEWYKGISIQGGMALTERTIAVESASGGVRIDVFNFSADVNSRSHVAFFRAGVDLRRAVARTTGMGGQVLPVEPGTYDVLVRYAPSTEVQEDLLIEGLVVPADGDGVRLQIDLERELGVLRISAFHGERNVSEWVNMIVKQSGADRVAGLSVLDVVGVGEHYIPAGTYDIYFEFHQPEGAKKRFALPSVTIVSGAIWEQRFDAAASSWLPSPARAPVEPLRPINWLPPPLPEPPGNDDDSAVDDDDSAKGAGVDDDDSAKISAADDDDSARAPEAPDVGTTPGAASDDPVRKGSVPEHERAEAPSSPPVEGL
jgi:hypothetical protein